MLTCTLVAQEYEIRKNENKRYAEKLGIPFVDADYDADEWYARTRGMEYDPERGRRCSACFDMRMERTAEYARDHSFDCAWAARSQGSYLLLR